MRKYCYIRYKGDTQHLMFHKLTIVWKNKLKPLYRIMNEEHILQCYVVVLILGLLLPRASIFKALFHDSEFI